MTQRRLRNSRPIRRQRQRNRRQSPRPLLADIPFFTPDELWDKLDAEPDARTTNTGNVRYEATLADYHKVVYVLGGIILPTSDEATVVVATTYDSGEQLIRIDVSIDGDPHLQTASLVVENRGNTPDVAEIGDGLALPTYSPPVISADTNSWTATGTYRETADSLTGDPWTATGRVQEGGPD